MDTHDEEFGKLIRRQIEADKKAKEKRDNTPVQGDGLREATSPPSILSKSSSPEIPDSSDVKRMLESAFHAGYWLHLDEDNNDFNTRKERFNKWFNENMIEDFKKFSLYPSPPTVAGTSTEPYKPSDSEKPNNSEKLEEKDVIPYSSYNNKYWYELYEMVRVAYNEQLKIIESRDNHIKFLQECLNDAVRGVNSNAKIIEERDKTISDLRERVKELEEENKTTLREHVTNDCVLGWSEVKFCNIRNGDGGKCRHCLH